MNGHTPRIQDAKALVDLAFASIADPSGVMEGRWPRAVAALGRQAAEAALEDYWRRTEPSIAGSSLRAQLLCLPSYFDDPKLAHELSAAWVSLSAACHYRPYELPPAESELRAWLTTTARFVAQGLRG